MQGPWIRMRYFFFTYQIFPSHKRKKKKPKKNIKPWQQETSSLQKMVQQQGFVGAVGEICTLVKEIIQKTIQVLSHAKFHPFRLHVRVGGEDAAVTAMEYGSVCAVVYPVLGMLFSVVKAPDPQVNITADYSMNSSELYFNGKLSVRPIWVLMALCGVLLQYIGQKIKNPKIQMIKGGASK